VKRGDTVVLSSHPIPGNEETVSRAINRLMRFGANVIYDALAPIHVSGHASQEEQKFLINLVRPKNFLPIHGELRMLKRHAWLAEQVGVPAEHIVVAENGQIVELSDGKLKLGERIPGGYVFVDGESIGDIDHDVMKEREQLARNGIVIIDLSVDKVKGRLIHEPEVITRGFLSPEDAERLIPEIRKRVMNVVNSGGLGTEKEISGAVKSYLHEQTKRKPMVFVALSKA